MKIKYDFEDDGCDHSEEIKSMFWSSKSTSLSTTSSTETKTGKPNEQLIVLPQTSCDYSNRGLTIVPLKLTADLPSNQFHCKNILHINLSHNALEGVFDWSATLKYCVRLRTLDLSHNELTSISNIPPIENESTTQESKHILQSLDLSFNKFYQVPSFLPCKVLQISYNEIRVASLESILNSPYTELLGLHLQKDRPISQPPVEICARGLASMRRHYTAMLRDSPEWSPEMDALVKPKGKDTEVSYMPHFVEVVEFDNMPMAKAEIVQMDSMAGNVVEKEKNEGRKEEMDIRNYGMESASGIKARGAELRAKAMSRHKSLSSSKSSSSLAVQKELAAIHTHISVVDSKPINNFIDRGNARFPEYPPHRCTSEPNRMHSHATHAIDYKSRTNMNNSVKVVLLGAPESGKSHLLHVLSDKSNFSSPVSSSTTDTSNNVNCNESDALQITECTHDGIEFRVWDVQLEGGYDHSSRIHELFYSPRALYVISWNMAFKNVIENYSAPPIKHDTSQNASTDPFSLDYDDDDDDDDDDLEDYDIDLYNTSNTHSVVAAASPTSLLDKDIYAHIDKHVQPYIERVQSQVPGATFLVVCTHEDFFMDKMEAARRAVLLRERLQHHEEASIQHLQLKLDRYTASSTTDSNTTSNFSIANSNTNSETKTKTIDPTVVARLKRKLLPQNRPKFVWSGDSPFASAIRLSSSFKNRIVQAVTQGMEFHGHVQVSVPKYYHVVKQLVRELRLRYKLITLKQFHEKLMSQIQLNREELIDALLFLANIGEVSYFAGTAFEFSQEYVFLNPRWLFAVAKLLEFNVVKSYRRTSPFKCKQMNVVQTNDLPILHESEALMLLQSHRQIQKGINRAIYGKGLCSPIEFLLLLFIEYGLLIPLDVAANGVKKEDKLLPDVYFVPHWLVDAGGNGGGEMVSSQLFSYKCAEFWKGALSTTLRFYEPRSLPSAMERVTSYTLRSIFQFSSEVQILQIQCWKYALFLLVNIPDPTDHTNCHIELFVHIMDNNTIAVSCKGNIKDDGFLLWNGGYKLVTNSIHQALQDCYEYEKDLVCPICLANYPLEQSKRWPELYMRQSVLAGVKCVRCDRGHIVSTALVSGLGMDQVEGSGSLSNVSAAASEHRFGTDYSSNTLPIHLDPAPLNYDDNHTNDHISRTISNNTTTTNTSLQIMTHDKVPIQEIFGGVVLIGLWNGTCIERIGSGFVADAKRGLIVTAAHTLMDIEGHEEKSEEEVSPSSFGKYYFGNDESKVYIGTSLLPSNLLNDGNVNHTRKYELNEEAVFRYRAVIVSADPLRVDACVLRIVTRMDEDVPGYACDDRLPLQTERIVSSKILKETGELQALKQYYEELPQLEENVRLLGHNQESFDNSSSYYKSSSKKNSYHSNNKKMSCINMCADVVVGHVRQMWRRPKQMKAFANKLNPRMWIVLNSATINGHSGGPCVNMQGEVIGILSYSDENGRRCFVVPATEW
eukprot:CAMPEP_0116062036 /NCGR_PEP_ID=MMETSP0322-20121206/7473_1 /TAXON_ID=163516 /ORGANISM="Leptocylindrus danicus var. apora, Strain B651" /LENGTH=1467 /DNA_ID=CAMNT_0003547173 /DNA_START=192 /DNA_END=4592 /DNA_ORIENTATION=-